MTAGIHRIRAVQVRSVIEYGGQVLADDPYFRGRSLDQYSVNAVSSVFRNHSRRLLLGKGGPHGPDHH